MKAIAIVTLLLSLSSFAANNPQRRICLNNNSIFWTYDFEENLNDNIAFCAFGSAEIGSISLIKLIHENLKTFAVSSYFQSRRQSGLTCSQVEAKTELGVDSNGVEKAFCVFDDYSFISEETLSKGWHHIDNVELSSLLLN